MSQPSLREKFDDEQILSTALAIELEDVKNSSPQLKLEKNQTYTQLERGLLYKKHFQRTGQY